MNVSRNLRETIYSSTMWTWYNPDLNSLDYYMWIVIGKISNKPGLSKVASLRSYWSDVHNLERTRLKTACPHYLYMFIYVCFKKKFCFRIIQISLNIYYVTSLQVYYINSVHIRKNLWILIIYALHTSYKCTSRAKKSKMNTVYNVIRHNKNDLLS